MPHGSRGSFSSIARRRYRPTPAGSHHRPPARSSRLRLVRRASSGGVKDVSASARRRAPRTSAPWPSRQAKPAPRPSASSANHRPASASPRADALHRQPARSGTKLSAAIRARSALTPQFAGQNDPRVSPSCQQSHPLSRLKRRPLSRPILSHLNRTSRTVHVTTAEGDRRSAYARLAGRDCSADGRWFWSQRDYASHGQEQALRLALARTLHDRWG